MSGSNLLSGCRGPESQALGSVMALLKYEGKNIDQLPGVVLLDSVVLVLASKRDQYYMVTQKACSCPSFIYTGPMCKHQRKYFPEPVDDPRGLSSGKYCETDDILGAYDGPCLA